MKYTLNKTDKIIKGEITLPTSKSISNRVLIINALSYSPYKIKNLSDSDDTIVLDKMLNSNTNKFNIGHAGTAMRFLTAFISKIVGEWEITGSARMQERPIGILVDALRKLGANIEYVGKEGYPPLKILGSGLKGGVLELDGSVSSQYISALLMIAPTIQNGLTLKLKNKVISSAYIDLTLKLMKKFGIRYMWKGNEIRIEEQQYRPVEFSVEADWSGASYLYELVAMADEGELKVNGLQLKSLQGDCAQAEWFEKYFGIESKQEGDAVRLTKKAVEQLDKLQLNFIENPDLAQTFAVLCVMKGLPFHFTGLETLKIKETDRIAALQNELSKFGAELTEPQHGDLAWDGTIKEELKQDVISIKTYKDHRMALAFAPAAMFHQNLIIEEPMVVTKSYPKYWEDLEMLGYTREIEE